MTLGPSVRAKRQEHGWTLRELASRSELSVSYLSDLENGKRGIDVETLGQLARVLGVMPGWLMAGHHAPPPEAPPLPPSLLTYARSANLRFQTAFALHACALVCVTARRDPKALASWNWAKFHAALKPWLEDDDG